MKSGILFLFLLILVFSSFSQYNFIDYQRNNPRVALAYKNRVDTLKKQAEKAGLEWPIQQIYLRSFKYDSQLEIWARNDRKDAFKLFKTYKVCALSGALGPKRIQGDYQVPEGFYEIDEFKPKSNYYLSLRVNYPNASDQILSDSINPGGDIYIHGTCLTIGCIPIMTEIEEVYILAAQAKTLGQDFIPIHIFPVRFNREKSAAYLDNITKNDSEYLRFTEKLKLAYDFFEQHHKLPIVSINKKGEYVVLY